jgi:hypothetical protein
MLDDLARFLNPKVEHKAVRTGERKRGRRVNRTIESDLKTGLAAFWNIVDPEGGEILSESGGPDDKRAVNGGSRHNAGQCHDRSGRIGRIDFRTDGSMIHDEHDTDRILMKTDPDFLDKGNIAGECVFRLRRQEKG